MRSIIKLIIFFIIGITLYTLYANMKAGHPWTLSALQQEFKVTLGLAQKQGKVISQSAGQESGKVLGEMTRRMVDRPILEAITSTLSDEAQAIPYNICKPVVENYEQQ